MQEKKNFTLVTRTFTALYSHCPSMQKNAPSIQQKFCCTNQQNAVTLQRISVMKYATLFIPVRHLARCSFRSLVAHPRGGTLFKKNTMTHHYRSDRPTVPPEYQSNPFRGCLNMLTGAIIGLALCALLSMLSSCSTVRQTSTDERQHTVQDIVNRMDSLMSVRTVMQQDSAWRESILRQFQSIREKSDTSHFVVVDTAGKVIREKIVINNLRESSSQSEREERQLLLHRLDVQDSMISYFQLQMQHTDSLLCLRTENKIQEVAKPLSWWQKLRLYLGNLVLIAVVVAAGYKLFRLWLKYRSGGIV